MPIKKWLLQAIILLPVLFLVFAAVQYLKGRGMEYSMQFGIFWSTVSTAVFFATRIYYYRKGLVCKVCDGDEMTRRQGHDQ